MQRSSTDVKQNRQDDADPRWIMQVACEGCDSLPSRLSPFPVGMPPRQARHSSSTSFGNALTVAVRGPVRSHDLRHTYVFVDCARREPEVYSGADGRLDHPDDVRPARSSDAAGAPGSGPQAGKPDIRRRLRKAALSPRIRILLGVGVRVRLDRDICPIISHCPTGL